MLFISHSETSVVGGMWIGGLGSCDWMVAGLNSRVGRVIFSETLEHLIKKK